MSFRLAASFAATAFLFSCASAPSVPTPVDTDAGEVVELRFDWPAGWNVPVEAVTERSFSLAGHRQSNRQVFRWRMTTEAVEGGLSVRERDVEIVEGAEEMLEIAAAAGQAVWIVVSPEGEIVRFEGLDQLASLPERIAEKSGRTIPPEMEAFLASLDPVQIKEGLIDDWNVFVGAWVEADVEVGDVLAYTGEGANRMTGEGVGLSVEWTVAGRTPCTAQEEALRCVRLETVSRPDQETVAQMVAQTFGQLLEDHGLEISFGTYEVRAVLVADPNGLIPYRYDRQRVVVVQTNIEGEDVTLARDETLRRTYHHP